MEKVYIAIDLKSFYASVECVDRGLDPLETNLTVADLTRTDKTICLAVSPSLKSFGIPGRPRLFELKQKVANVNAERKRIAGKQTKKTVLLSELKAHPEYGIDYIVAKPRMARYMAVSSAIYDIYLSYVASEDMHVYSVDEVFIDATPYLKNGNITAHDFAMRIIRDVLRQTGITATCGIGTNLYLAKIAMDIVAKKMPPDKDGVRIAELDEQTYRETLWNHTPLTDFWRIGKGIERRLNKMGIHTMGEIARCSLGESGEYYNEDRLFSEFGINAELLIDHAWGYEPCTMEDIHAYRPAVNSLSIGQVLSCAYAYDKAGLIVREMADNLSLDLSRKGLLTDQLTLTLGYDIENDPDDIDDTDRYGRNIPSHAHGTIHLPTYSSATGIIVSNAQALFEKIARKHLSVRRINLTAEHVLPPDKVPQNITENQLDFFTDEEDQQKKEIEKVKNDRLQTAILAIQSKLGKNGILKGMNLEEGGTAMERNGQIGGHKA